MTGLPPSARCPRCDRELSATSGHEVWRCETCRGLLVFEPELERVLRSSASIPSEIAQESDLNLRVVAMVLDALRSAPLDSGLACPACSAPMANWWWGAIRPGWYCRGAHLWLDGSMTLALVRAHFPDGEPPQLGRMSLLARALRDLHGL